MKSLFLVLMIVISANVYAEEANRCVSPNAPKTSQKVMPNGEVANQVLCCCRTANGGQCCNYVNFCGGSFIPGCMCSGHSVDAEPDALNKDESKVKG